MSLDLSRLATAPLRLTSAAFGCGSLELRKADRRVRSTTKCAPPQQRRSCAETSMRRSWGLGFLTFTSRKECVKPDTGSFPHPSFAFVQLGASGSSWLANNVHVTQENADLSTCQNFSNTFRHGSMKCAYSMIP